MIFLFCQSTPDGEAQATRQKLVEFALPFVTRSIPGHRVTAVAVLAQVSSGPEEEQTPIEHVLGPVDRLTPGTSEQACWELAHTDLEQPSVRKHATRGLANVLLLAADKESELAQLMKDRAILDRFTLSLKEADTDLVQEAVNASHRAAVLRPIGCDPEVWESRLLTELGPVLHPLTASSSPAVKKSVFYLLSKLSQIYATHLRSTSASGSSFSQVEARVAVVCAIRLWDNSVAVSDSAKRCLAMLLRDPESHDSLLTESAKSAAALRDLVHVLVNARDRRLLTQGCDLEYHVETCCGFINGITDGGIEIAAATIAVNLLADLSTVAISRDTLTDLHSSTPSTSSIVKGFLRVPARLEEIMCAPASGQSSAWENYTVFYDFPKPHQRTSDLEMLWLYQVAHTTAKILERFGYVYVACGGTLIGALRDGGIVAHDDDIDLCTDKRNFRRMMKDSAVLKAFNANGLQLLQFSRYKGGVGCLHCRADRERCRPLDILEMVKHPQDPSRFIMHFCYNEVRKKGDAVDRADCRGRTFPVDVLDHAIHVPFGSSSVLAPVVGVAEKHLTGVTVGDFLAHLSGYVLPPKQIFTVEAAILNELNFDVYSQTAENIIRSAFSAHCPVLDAGPLPREYWLAQYLMEILAVSKPLSVLNTQASLVAVCIACEVLGASSPVAAPDGFDRLRREILRLWQSRMRILGHALAEAIDRKYASLKRRCVSLISLQYYFEEATQYSS
ncbi:hypothetical protein Pmar_PMAR005227 [Perkinsus marinus ATCC 50983]|uniref:LicD/FKTN/FKRP nucleotidyltransferase domain-containing protein n=1 Tax=Perkinsus marinus (strain ATCC 50983 / TXsc) TaxID=423536 RepID=C5KAZ3_PERM5|nr:hypothetical protein Pmar_PMAR005227 [Perkinsus marinus ATCC 50983]EER18319.1 hypothetical protein Pmar_PMAR005227 [Perkinsus marinus ATCC 50983]|eukprot:XP_002786523.1 hypothetical protein Pmar_PMAR005227 [Perkinsus marinus ATCC 50983]